MKSPGALYVGLLLLGVCGCGPHMAMPRNLEILPDRYTFSAPGETVQFTALLKRSDGAVVDDHPRVFWTSSNPNIVAIDPNGLATALRQGSSSILATSASAEYFAVNASSVTVAFDQWSALGPIQVDGVVETRVCGIAVDPLDDQVLFVQGPAGLYISRNFGATYTLAVKPPSSSGITGCGALTLDPIVAGRVWFGALFGPLYRSNDSGLTWQLLSSPPGGMHSLVVSRSEPHTLIASGPDVLFPQTRTIIISHDDGETWMPLPFGAAARPDLVGRFDLISWFVAEDPVDGAIYTSLELGAHPAPYQPPFMRTLDRGLTWQDVAGWGGPGPIVPWHALNALIDESTHAVIVQTEGAGLFRSTDHGATWARLGNSNFTHDLIRDPNHPAVYFGAEYPGSRLGGVLVSTDNAATFQRFGLNGQRAADLALNGNSTRLFAAVYESGIYVTPLVSLAHRSSPNVSK